MATKYNLLLADAEFLSTLPDLSHGSTTLVAVQALLAAGRLQTIKEAKDYAEDAYQAVVNSSVYQQIPTVAADRSRKALARTFAPSLPAFSLSRHSNFNDLLVVAAAHTHSAAIVTTKAHYPFYKSFSPALSVDILKDIGGLETNASNQQPSS